MAWAYQFQPGGEQIFVQPLPLTGRRPRFGDRLFRLIVRIVRNIRRKERLLARTSDPQQRRVLLRSIQLERRQLRLLLSMTSRHTGFTPRIEEIEREVEIVEPGSDGTNEMWALYEDEMDTAEMARDLAMEATDEEEAAALNEIFTETMSMAATLASVARSTSTVYPPGDK